MKGTVISIDHQRQFGFVKDKSGSSNHFSKRDFCNQQEFPSVSIGDYLEFEPTAGPKGMKATNVKVAPVYEHMKLVDKKVILREGQQVRDGEHLVLLKRIQSPWYDSPHEARNAIQSILDCSRANFCGGIEMRKESFSQGNNYYKTMHSFVGEVGVLMRVAKSDNPDAPLSDEELGDHLRAISTQLTDISDGYDKFRKKQESGNWGIILGTIVILIILAMIFH